MTDNEKRTKKSSQEMMPVSLRLGPETTERFRNAAKEFSNQDAAMNGFMAAFEREKLLLANPQFTEDLQMFESYQRYLSTKFIEVLNAMTSAEERAKNDVQKLLESKDSVILKLQEELKDSKQSKERYEEFYRNAVKENKELEEAVNQGKLALEGMRKEMTEKDVQHASILADKERLNEILSKNIEESNGKLEEYKDYPKRFQEKDTQIRELEEQIHKMEDQRKEDEYQYRMGLLEAEQEHERARVADRAEYDAKMQALRDKYEVEKERLREKLENYQTKIQTMTEEYAHKSDKK